MLVTAHNRGAEPATLHLLPTLWFRNTWSGGGARPRLEADDGSVRVVHDELGAWTFTAEDAAQLLFCENETNDGTTPHPKDAVNDYLVHGTLDSVNPDRTGTKVAAHHPLEIAAGGCASIRVRLEWIAIAFDPPGDHDPLWDEADGFFYDAMRMPDGTTIPLKVRSLVGLLPLCAATVFHADDVARNPGLLERAVQFVTHFADAVPSLAHLPGPSPEGHRMLALVDEQRLRRILTAMLDEDEFLGAHGIRAISRRHLEQPCVFDWAGRQYAVRYLPAESDSGMFGGNSNWRGPVWFPMNLVILRGLAQFHRYYGDRLKVECPTGSGQEMNLLEVATEISRRLASTFCGFMKERKNRR